jgi:hypothetical protein
MVVSSVVQLSHLKPILWITIKDIPIFLKKKDMYFKKKLNLLHHPITFFFNKNLPIMNIPIFNFQKMTNMHKGYAYQIHDCIAYKRKLNKEQRISTPRTKPKFVGELNCNSMKFFTQLQHKFLDPTTPYTNPPQPTKLANYSHHQLEILQKYHVF